MLVYGRVLFLSVLLALKIPDQWWHKNWMGEILRENRRRGIGEGNGNPLQCSCLENPRDGGAWWAAVYGVAQSRTRLKRLSSLAAAKSRTQLSNFPFTFHFHALEKEMATYSSVLAWRIPGTAEPGRLPSMGSHRVGHD